jgi:hypothetical protein
MGLNVYLTGDGDDNDDRRIHSSEVMYNSLDVHDKMASIKLPWMMESIFSVNAYLIPRT